MLLLVFFKYFIYSYLIFIYVYACRLSFFSTFLIQLAVIYSTVYSGYAFLSKLYNKFEFNGADASYGREPRRQPRVAAAVRDAGAQRDPVPSCTGCPIFSMTSKLPIHPGMVNRCAPIWVDLNEAMLHSSRPAIFSLEGELNLESSREPVLAAGRLQLSFTHCELLLDQSIVGLMYSQLTYLFI